MKRIARPLFPVVLLAAGFLLAEGTDSLAFQGASGRRVASPVAFEYETFTWEAGQPPTKMIGKDEGFCYISAITGALDGGGETAKVYIGDDGAWYLGGETLNGALNLTATAVKIKRP